MTLSVSVLLSSLTFSPSPDYTGVGPFWMRKVQPGGFDDHGHGDDDDDDRDSEPEDN